MNGKRTGKEKRGEEKGDKLGIEHLSAKLLEAAPAKSNKLPQNRIFVSVLKNLTLVFGFGFGFGIK